MKTNGFISMAVLAAILSISSGESVKAVGHSNSAINTPSGATITGKVKFEGTAPKVSAINMAADPACAKQHRTGVATQDIVVGPAGSLQNVVVFVVDGLGDRRFDPPTQPAVLEQKGCMYQPHVLALEAHQPLEVVNEDSTLHNVHVVPTNNREWNKAEPPGRQVDGAFPREEVAVLVKCDVHPWMRSYVAVFKHPYFAVTREDGTFDLSSLPPGTYTIEAWHEKLGTATRKVTVGANEKKAVDFVFKSKPGS